MSSFTASVNSYKTIVSGIGLSARADDSVVNKSLYVALSAIEENVTSATEKCFTNDIMLIFDDTCAGKLFTITKTFHVLIVGIYTKIIIKSPGFINRNILNSMLAICNGKNSSTISKECAINIIGVLMEFKASDCGSQINETIQNIGKLIKVSDFTLRIAVLKALTSIVTGSGFKISDLHAELVKLATRLSADKIPDVRYQLAVLLKSVAQCSLGCTTLPAEALLSPCNKGLDEDVAIVQDAFANALASVFVEQITVFTNNQEQAKYGAARGGTDKTPKAKPAPRRISMSLTSTKKVAEDYDFRTVVGQVFRQICRSPSGSTVRAGYITTLGYLIKDTLNQLNSDDFDWLVANVIAVLRDPAFASVSYEEGSFLKARFSYLIRSSITSNLTEARLLSFGSQLAKSVSSMDTGSKTDLEMQLAFSELSHVVTVLGAAAISLVDEVNAAATMQLRHSSFGVRSAAAHVMSSLSVIGPVVAVEILRNALHNTRTQAKQLVIFDGTDGGVTAADIGLDEVSTGDLNTNAQSNSGGSNAASNAVAPRKKNAKELERLQRMYYFHGHTLVISILLKNTKYLPTGLPLPLIAEIYALGIELLQHDVFSAPVAVRNVSCSVVRAGSLIVSSCLSLGYDVAKIQLRPLLNCCNFIFKMANMPASAVPANNQQSATRADDLVYEIMSVEAALVCISTLLLFCPEALTIEPDCQDIVVEGLETSFKALKSKYQPKYRTHFRFCTLHVILMECFSWLPVGIYPHSCQQVFVEALRVFRDCIQTCFDCTGLCDYISSEHTVLSIGGISNYRVPSSYNGAVPPEILMSEKILMLKLENNSIALQKKETEAFLATFGKDNYPCFSLNNTSEDTLPAALVPCAQIDSRTVDCAILLLSATFSQQSAEYQDKAIQLCSQAVAQFSKLNSKSLGMFASEEEKRRRDRKVYSTIRNVVAAVSAIVRAMPFINVSDTTTVTWQNALSDLLFDLLAQPFYSVRCAAASTLASFAFKVKNGAANIMSNVSHKIRSAMISSLARKGETMESYCGYLLALSSLWTMATGLSDVQSVLITTVFDCLRKNDSVVAFKAYGLLALSSIVQGFVSTHIDATAPQSTIDEAMVECSDVVEKTINQMETCLANLGCNDELDQFLVALLRLVSATLSLALKIRAPVSFTQRLLSIWKQVPSLTSNSFVLNERLSIFSAASPYELQDDIATYLFTQFRLVVERRFEYSIAALAEAVDGLTLLLTKYPLVACNTGLDSVLFLLLDYCLSCTTVSTHAPYTGLEIRRGIFQEESQGDDVKRLMRGSMRAIYALVAADVKRSPDTRLAYWVLLCRAVALNLRSVGQVNNGGGDTSNENGGGEGGGNEREQDEDDFGASDMAAETPKASSSSRMSNNEAMTYVTFATHCRDVALDRAPDLKYCRVQVKCVAIRCIKIALSTVSNTLLLRDSLHVQLGLARQKTNEILSQLVNPTDDQLSEVPQPIALFLNDLINLGCACATYTIDEKPILLLQNESMHMLQTVIALFLDAPDPDIAATLSEVSQDQYLSAENKILSQFMSQLLSAIRLCLSVVNCSELLVSTGSIMCSLIRGGFITDKVIARRLFKPLFALCEVQKEDAENCGGPYGIRTRVSALVSEDVATADHVVGSGMLAQLNSLTLNSVANSQVSDTIKTTITSMISEHLTVLVQVWHAIVVDGARISRHPVELMSSTDELSILRGALTFSPQVVRVAELPNSFNYAVPHALLAYTSSKYFKEENIVSIFALSSSLLNDWTQQSVSTGKVGLLVSTFSKIAAKDSNKSISSALWSQALIQLLALTNIDKCAVVVTELVSSLLTVCPVITPHSQSDDVQFWSILARLCCSCWQGCLPKLFVPHSALGVSNSHTTSNSLLKLECSYPKPEENYLVDDTLIAVSNTNPSTLSLVIKSSLKLTQLNPSLVHYMLKVFSRALLLLLTSHPSVGGAKQKAMTVASDQIVASVYTLTALVASATEQEGVCVMILHDMTSWLRLSSIASSQETITAVADSMLLAWRAAGIAIDKQNLVPSPVQISSCLLGDSGDTSSTTLVSVKAILTASIKFIQGYSKDLGGVLAEEMLPTILCRLSYASNDSEVRTLLLKALLMLIGLASEETHRNLLVELIVTPLCSQMAMYQQSDAAFLNMCGKGFTHLARLSPDTFRGQVGLLSESHRNLLQQVMMQALQQQQQGGASSNMHTAQQNGGASTSGLKAININKYKSGGN